ncbi:FGGY family carbohydrate kinase [Microbacterium sp. STN6]|uniref:FGGY-family carbohydrate kinase n=1 Tax=Microbacterium sp. STN6 TaxID=2995588 RepID=UPI00226084D4|nr:FGGY family carbohydrate kinase [Microbacterium sp. STN6]MCX7522832.1 FGGY family carbohydrate kinase [Microbacterium sp. STN6]
MISALGIDIGTSNTKVTVLELDDDPASRLPVRERSTHALPTPADAGELVSVVMTLVSAAASRAASPVAAVGIASMAETGALLEPDGTPVGPLLRWNRVGGAKGAQALARELGAEALYEATGVPVVQKAPLAMWRGLAASGDARWHARARWAGMCDLVGLVLTGRLATDHTLAARTMAYRLPGGGHPLASGFDVDLLAAVGVSHEQLPEILAPGEPLGVVTAGAAAATGLPAGVPVTIAGHDHAVGAWAAGVRVPGGVANSVGTAEALIRVLGQPAHRGEARAAGMSLARAVDGEHETLLAGNPMAGALVDWLFETRMPGVSRDDALRSADRLPSEPGERLVLPYPRGRQSPRPDPEARFAVVGRDGAEAPEPEDAGEFVRLTVEALALQLRWMDAAQSAVASAERGEHIVSLGGPGGTNAAWWKAKTALLPAALARVTVSEPVASGAALLAAVRAGLCEAAAQLPLIRQQQYTNPAYDNAYTDFVAAATAQTERSRQAQTQGEK